MQAASLLSTYGISDTDLLQHPLQVIDQLLVLNASLDASHTIATRFKETPELWNSVPLLSLTHQLPTNASRALVRYRLFVRSLQHSNLRLT